MSRVIETLKNRWRVLKETRAQLIVEGNEYRRFVMRFPQSGVNGVLIPPGEEIDPTEKGRIVVASNDKSLKKKLEKGQRLTPADEQKIRQEGWGAIGGKYTAGQTPAGFRVSFTIDDPDAITYLGRHVGIMGAFLAYGQGKGERYSATRNIRMQGESLSYIFPNISVPPENLRSIHVYTRPEERSEIDPRYTRLSFFLKPPATLPNP